MASSGLWPFTLESSRPSGLWSVGELGGPGIFSGVFCRAVAEAGSWQGPRLEAASKLSSCPHPPPPRPNGGGPSEPGSCRPLGLLTQSCRAWLRQSLRLLTENMVPLGIGCGRTRRMAAALTPRRAVRASDARERLWTPARPPIGLGTTRIRDLR